MYSKNNALNTKSLSYTLVQNALFIALVFLFTKFINVRLPVSINGGLIHLGNVPLFIASIVFGARTGAIAGGIGMALFDLTSGWAVWAPFTFIVRYVMAYIIGYISASKRGESFWLNVLAIILGGIWMCLGYYFTEVILYGNWITPFTSIPGNILQIIVATIVSLPLVDQVKKRVF